jgi:pre-mRNA-processing factor 6
MWAKENWLGGDVRAACEVLKHTFMRNSESEQIWLAAIKFEAVNRESAVARELLVHAQTVTRGRQEEYLCKGIAQESMSGQPKERCP